MSLFSKATNALLAVVLFALTSQTTMAVEVDADAAIKNKFFRIGLKVNKIAPSPVQNLMQVFTNRGLFYASNDGQFLIHGKMFNMDSNMKNESEEAMAGIRLEGIAKFEDSMIVFPAKNEKHKITVFTDTTCGYCRKLHSQMSEYNDLGITVRYLAFPRGGLASNGFNELQSVWCAKDQQGAMTDVKAGDGVAASSCTNKIADHYDLGQAAGVSGTPAIILDDGSMIPGYQDPQKLIRVLEY